MKNRTSSRFERLQQRVGEAFEAYRAKKSEMSPGVASNPPPAPDLSPLEKRKQELLSLKQKAQAELDELETNPQMYEVRQSLFTIAKKPEGLLILNTMMMLYEQHKEEFKTRSPEIFKWFAGDIIYQHTPEALRSLALHIEAMAEVIERKTAADNKI